MRSGFVARCRIRRGRPDTVAAATDGLPVALDHVFAPQRIRQSDTKDSAYRAFGRRNSAIEHVAMPEWMQEDVDRADRNGHRRTGQCVRIVMESPFPTCRIRPRTVAVPALRWHRDGEPLARLDRPRTIGISTPIWEQHSRWPGTTPPLTRIRPSAGNERPIYSNSFGLLRKICAHSSRCSRTFSAATLLPTSPSRCRSVAGKANPQGADIHGRPGWK